MPRYLPFYFSDVLIIIFSTHPWFSAMGDPAGNTKQLKLQGNLQVMVITNRPATGIMTYNRTPRMTFKFIFELTF